MRSAIPLGRIAGIDVRLHWSTLLLPLFVLVTTVGADGGLGQGLRSIGFLAALFFFVVLHEVGHALMARRFGIRTEDIVLLPIGGLARIERNPDSPKQELLIALAGPAVNVVLCALLVPLFVLASLPAAAGVPLVAAAAPILFRLAVANAFLAIFNMLPAFPMDGGRVLRSLLEMRLGQLQATQIAGRVGMGFGGLLALAGLFSNPLLILIGLFVGLAARAEMGRVRALALLEGWRVRDAMQIPRSAVQIDLPLQQALRLHQAHGSDTLIVADGPRIAGALSTGELLTALDRLGPFAPLGDALHASPATLSADDRLSDVSARLVAQSGVSLVIDQGRPVGVLGPADIARFLRLRQTLGVHDDGGPSAPAPPVDRLGAA